MWQKLKWLLLISFIINAVITNSSYAFRKNYAADFLRYRSNIRSQAMGQLGVALSSKYQVSYFNPSLIRLHEENMFSNYAARLFFDDFVTSFTYKEEYSKRYKSRSFNL